MNPLGGTAQGAGYALARRGLKEVGASWHELDPSAEWPSVFGWVFYAYGLGLFGKLGVTAAWHRRRCRHPAGDLLHLLAAAVSLRPGGMAVANRDVRDAATLREDLIRMPARSRTKIWARAPIGQIDPLCKARFSKRGDATSWSPSHLGSGLRSA